MDVKLELIGVKMVVGGYTHQLLKHTRSHISRKFHRLSLVANFTSECRPDKNEYGNEGQK
jgi:hypothetical protein